MSGIPRFGSPAPIDAKELARRKERRLLSASDQAIMDQMDRKDLAYRAGWPTLRPLPLDTFIGGAHATISDATSRLESVQDILDVQQIRHKTLLFVYRVPKHGSAGLPKEDFLTLLISIDFERENTNLDRAIIRIRGHLELFPDTVGVQIEILDYRIIGGLQHFVLRPNETFIMEKWDEVCDAVIKIIDPFKWLSIECLRRGIHDDITKCPPTLVITSPTAEKEIWWAHLLPAVRRLVKKIVPHLEVELLKGISLFGVKNSTTVDAVGMSAFRSATYMGASIGIDAQSSGTVGGSIRMEFDKEVGKEVNKGVGKEVGKNDGKEVKTFGITNWHVIRDSQLNSIVQKVKSHALLPNHPTLKNNEQRVFSPSAMDTRGRVGQLKKDLAYWTANPQVPNQKAMKQEVEDKLEYLRTCRTGLGTIFAGSGRRTVKALMDNSGRKAGKATIEDRTYEYPLDWALIDLLPHRSVENRIPSNPLEGLDADQLAKVFTNMVVNQDCNIWSYFDVNSGEVQVLKHGRSSKWTQGVINPVTVKINPTGDKQISDVYGFTENRYGSAFAVSHRLPLKPFAVGGDSGSIVTHDGSGAWLGLLFGVTESGQGLMMPIDLVIKDIEAITGGKVLEPVYKDPFSIGTRYHK